MELKQSSELFWEVEDWWRYAGEDTRKQFIEKLTSNCKPTCNTPYCSAGRKPDMSYTVSFENDWYRLGNRLVYIYVTDEGVPFYVGMGDMYRPVNLESRSKAFLDEFKKHSYCKVYIIATNLYKVYADEVESLCIWYLLSKNWKLTNIQKIQFSEYEYQQFQDDYPEIINVMEKFNDDCLSEILGEKSGIDEYIIKKSDKDNRYHSQNIWEIDGVIKSAREWCKEYNENFSSVIQRIVNYGCTPKEALTFPKKKDWTYRTCKEFWKSQGLFPGTDTTSKVVCMNSRNQKWIDLDTFLSNEDF